MTSNPIFKPLWRAILAASLAAAAVVGCGGGVGTGGTGGELAPGYAAGPITGFGSVIVGGVRFDDSSAEVQDGDSGRRSRDELRLGMMVEIESSAISTDANGSSANATRIRFESEMAGLVAAVNVASHSLSLLGQTVNVDAATVFDERLDNGLAGLRVGQALEIYAVYDPAGQRYRATRIEPSSLVGGLRLRALLSQVDSAAHSLRVGSTSYSYAGASGLPAGLAAGQFVRLRLALAIGSGSGGARWGVQSFGSAQQPLGDADGVKLEGSISALTSSVSFSVNGRAVDASAATFSNGSAGVVLGARVEVEGLLRAGILRASKVKTISDDEVRDRGFELNGAITARSVALATIVVRGVTVSTARSGLIYVGGTAADLVVGPREVQISGVLAADGRTLEATRIRFR